MVRTPIFSIKFNKMAKASKQDKTYRLVGDAAPLTFHLQSGNNKKLLSYDKVEKRNRAIRHCRNEKSIFIDEQSSNAVVEPILFEFGYLTVSFQDAITQTFLDKHPDNTLNGGGWFEEVDEAAEAKQDIEIEELIMDIKDIIRDKYKAKNGIAELEMVVSILLGSLDQAAALSADELKRVLYQEAEANPKFFINEDTEEVNVFDDENKKRRYLTLRGLKNGIIVKTINGRSMTWSDKSIIFTAPIGKDLVESFSQYLATDEGMQIAEELLKD